MPYSHGWPGPSTTCQPISSSVPPSSTSASTKASSASTSSTATTPSQSSAVPATATKPAEPTASPSRLNDIGAKVGAGVGVPLGVALLAAVIYILFLKSGRSRGLHLLRHLRSHQEDVRGAQEQQLFPKSLSFHGYDQDELMNENDPTL